MNKRNGILILLILLITNSASAIYDPQMGRFLSADPLVKDNDNLQAYNRFSYAHNNPLKYVDPTGYVVWRPVEEEIQENLTAEERQRIESRNAQIRAYNEWLDSLNETDIGKKIYANLDSREETFSFREIQSKGRSVGYQINEHVLDGAKVTRRFRGAVLDQGSVVSPGTFDNAVLEPTLAELDRLTGRNYNSENARDLLLSTAIHESGGFRTRFQDNGPALSFFQIEPGTFDDIYTRYLNGRGREILQLAVDKFIVTGEPSADLVYNDGFSAVLARLKYSLSSDGLPVAGDIGAQAEYWFSFYNQGKIITKAGKVSNFINDNRRVRNE